ncbi:MAG: tetratricopeptide repeat protein [Phycisphaerales bacterium]
MSVSLTPPSPRNARRRGWYLLAAALISLATIAAYSNSLHNAFVLDDGYGIVQNPYVRSLRFVPRYFVDPFTLTVNKRNAEYRPLMSLSFAINYQVSGYATWSWHVVNLVLHAHVAFWLFIVGRLLFGTGRVRLIAWLSERGGDAASLIAACVFSLHPITSGIANYAWSRSSLLVAAFLMPATALLLRAVRDGGGPSTMLAPAALYALALLSKPEAIGFVAIAAFVQLWLAPERAGRSMFSPVLSARALKRIAPLAVMAVAYLLLRRAVMPAGQSANWSLPGDTPLKYLLTQTRAWWYYIGQALAPFRMIADHTTFPRVTDLASRAQMLPVALAVAGWLVVAGLTISAARRAPSLAILVMAYFIYLAPSSSIIPLAEMVNEHRPYMPISGLFLLAAVAAMAAAERLCRRPVGVVASGAIMLAIPLALLTRERNLVWRDDLAFWGDIVSKEPQAARAQMNYGIALMSRARFIPARDAFEQAARYAPLWNLPHVNLGIALSRLNEPVAARTHFDRAVELAPADPNSYSYRGDFRKAQGDLDGAIDDYRAAARHATIPLREVSLLADALIDARRFDDANEAIARGEALDRAAMANLRARLEQAGARR